MAEYTKKAEINSWPTAQAKWWYGQTSVAEYTIVHQHDSQQRQQQQAGKQQ